MESISLLCPICHQSIKLDQYFCANCGKDLKEKSIAISPQLQLGIYAVSIFLPPLGFWPGYKYAIKKNPDARRVGIIAIVLTIISSAVSIWAIFVMFQEYLNQLNSFLY